MHNNIINLICEYIGKEYPADGVDLIHECFSRAGIFLPPSLGEIARSGQWVYREHIHAGDVLVFSTKSHRIDHIGLCIDSGMMIHVSPYTGIVVKDKLSPIWSKSLICGCRFWAMHQSSIEVGSLVMISTNSPFYITPREARGKVMKVIQKTDDLVCLDSQMIWVPSTLLVSVPE